MYVGYLNPDSSVLTSFEEEVSNFTKWCRDNFLAVNANKTKEMVIDFRRHKSEIPNSTVNDKTIERVSSYKYLGIEIDDKLKFEICTTSKVTKLQQRMFFLGLYYLGTVLQDSPSERAVLWLGLCFWKHAQRRPG